MSHWWTYSTVNRNLKDHCRKGDDQVESWGSFIAKQIWFCLLFLYAGGEVKHAWKVSHRHTEDSLETKTIVCLNNCLKFNFYFNVSWISERLSFDVVTLSTVYVENWGLCWHFWSLSLVLKTFLSLLVFDISCFGAFTNLILTLA